MTPNQHDLITEFLAYGASDRAYSQHTLRAYRSALNAFALHVEALGVDLPFATAAQLLAYDQTHARTLRPRSRARDICAIRALYHWLTCEKKLLTRNPALKLKPPTLDVSSRSCPLGTIRARLLDACDRLKKPKLRTLARALLGCMFHAGLRPDDVCKLQLGDVILQDNESYLIVQKGKHSKRREVPLSDDLSAWLRAWLAVRNVVEDTHPWRPRTAPVPSPNFFVHGPRLRPVTQYYLRVVLADVKLVAGVVDDNLTPHSLRHSCATTLYEQGVDLPVIQEILGHESVQTTMNYVHPTDKRKFAAVQKLNKPANAPPEKPRIKPIRLLKRQR